LSDSISEVKRSPLLGEHTDEILGDVIGFSADEIAKIKESGALTAPDKKEKAA
jgi:formyl-CoA transferase